MSEERKGGVEWLPWSELTGGQKLGRALVGLVVGAVLFAALRGVLGMLHLEHHAVVTRTVVDDVPVVLSPTDRADGITSLCKVFQIYGMPKTSADADAAAKNAGELFKLAGNQSPARSAAILKALAHEFTDKKLSVNDCASAGVTVAAPGDTADDQPPP